MGYDIAHVQMRTPVGMNCYRSYAPLDGRFVLLGLASALDRF